MSLTELATDSRATLHQVQLFEQRQLDINNAAAMALLTLSKTPAWPMEDLL
jgi:hypothetical protein